MSLTSFRVAAQAAAMSDDVDPDEVVIPALLRAARNAYALAVRRALAAADIHDMPRNGPYVLGGLANHGATLATLINDLQVTKQAASQLIDTLVLRGYLDRHVDAEDRRRLAVTLTERGLAAAEEVQRAVRSVDSELAAMITTEKLAVMREGLFALAGIGFRLRGE